MDKVTRRSLLHCLERIDMPMGFGPHGDDDNMVQYNVPMDQRPQGERIACEKINLQFKNAVKITMDMPAKEQMPDLSNISKLCPKSAHHSHFNPSHQKASDELKTMFNQTNSLEDLLVMSCQCRDHGKVNQRVWLNAFCSSLQSRQDTKSFELPAIWEVIPSEFLSKPLLNQARHEIAKPEGLRNVIRLSERNITGLDANPENKLAYYREDIGLNSHHWHWHLAFSLTAKPGEKDRKGERFYSMHHEMLARYDAERFANGLPRVKPLLIDEPIQEGYFPKLSDRNSSINWASRQAGTTLKNINRAEDPAWGEVGIMTLDELKRCRDRIFHSIDTGTFFKNGKYEKLNIEILGDIVEGSNLTPDSNFYGARGYHNMGHIIIAYCHDPEFHHNEGPGVMSESTTAIRDPIFYRWHRHVDDIFNHYKKSLPPYEVSTGDLKLQFKGVSVDSISVTSEAGLESRPNSLRTYWQLNDVDLSRGLDFTRSCENNLGPVFARVRTLAHEKFTYTIMVNNAGGEALPATVRIFMAPRFNEHRNRFRFSDQRRFFFEMDKFVTQLEPGNNTIKRASMECSVTAPWSKSFREIEKDINAQDNIQNLSSCECAYPHHMLVPRGKRAGMTFDLVVFLTNYDEDKVPGKSCSHSKSSSNPMNYCGSKDNIYPDKKPMGYPFDRTPFIVPQTGELPATVEEYASHIENMNTIQVQVYHDENREELKTGGARESASVTTIGDCTGLEPCTPNGL